MIQKSCQNCITLKRKCIRIPYYKKCENCAGDGIACIPVKKPDHTSRRKSCDSCYTQKKKCIKTLTDQNCHYCKKQKVDCTYNIKTKQRQYYHTVRDLKLMTVYWNTLLQLKEDIKDYQSQRIVEKDLKERLNKYQQELPPGQLRILVCQLYTIRQPGKEAKELKEIVEEIDQQLEPSYLVSQVTEKVNKHTN